MTLAELKTITKDHPLIQNFIEVEKSLGTSPEEIDKKVEILIDELREPPSTEDYEKAREKRGRPKKKKEWPHKEKKKKFVVSVEETLEQIKNDEEIKKTLEQEFPKKKRGRPRTFEPLAMLCLIIWMTMETYLINKVMEQLEKYPSMLLLLGLPKIPSQRMIHRYYQKFEDKGLLKHFFHLYMYLSS